MINKNDMTEQEFTEYYYNIKKELIKKHPLRFLFFEITSRCNAHCEHCGSSCGDTIPKDEITGEEVKSVLKEIADNPNYNPNRIMLNITGGEPLVRKDLFELMKYATSLGFHWGMVSNGILVTQEIVDKMIDAGIYSVSISIDGLKETHEKFRRLPNCYEKILNGIKLMQDSKKIPVVQVITCVNKKNIDQLEDIYKLLLSLNVKEWRIIEVDPIGRAKNNKELLLDTDEYKRMFNFMIEKKKIDDGMRISYGCGHFLGKEFEGKVRENGAPFICTAGIITGSILSNGDIYVCPDVERRKELIQGNIRKDKFTEVWENKYKPYRDEFRTSNSKCKKCPDWKKCMGDDFHTWDFDNNKPRFCAREIFYKDYEKRKRGNK